jgi:hypothetical protein
MNSIAQLEATVAWARGHRNQWYFAFKYPAGSKDHVEELARVHNANPDMVLRATKGDRTVDVEVMFP